MSLLKRLLNPKSTRVTELVWVGPNGEVYPKVTNDTHPYAHEINAWVYACVTAISSAVASVPLRVEQKQGGEWREVTDGPLPELLAHVNKDEDSYSLFESTAAWLALYGNAYWRLLRASRNGPPQAIRVLRADRVRIKPGKGERSEMVAGYLFENGKGKPEHYADTDVVHFRTFSPHDLHYGQSPIKAIEDTINTYTAAMRHNVAFFKGGGVPACVISAEAQLDDDEVKRYRAMWEQWAGSEQGSRRPLILGGNMKLEVPGTSPDEITTMMLPRMLREAILAVLRVPPAIVGVYEYANYANVREQRRIFWSGCVLQYVRRAIGAINEQLAPLFGDDLRVAADTSSVAALQPEYGELAQAASKLVDRGIFTRDEARQRLFGMAPIGGDWGNAWWGPSSLALLTRRGTQKAKAPGAPDEGPTDAIVGTHDWAKSGSPTEGRIDDWYAEVTDKLLGQWYRELAGGMTDWLMQHGALASSHRVRDPELGSLVFDVASAAATLDEYIGPLLARNSAIDSAVETRQIAQEAHRAAWDSLAHGLAEGETAEQLAERIRVWAETKGSER